MAVQDYKINYKSDFVLTINGDAGWAVPFCIKFWTGMPSQAYFVGFDGVKYVNCRVGDTPTQLLVMFDDHHLPIGPLKMQIAYHTTIEEFPGSVFDEVTNARDVIVTIDGTDYQVLLDFTGEDAPELEFDLPAYANEAERIQNELQRQQNEADRIAAELQREQATAAAVQGAENVNAQLAGNILTITNRQGVSTSVNTKGERGEQGPVGPEGPQGEQGETGISIVSFTPKSETSTTIIYTVTFSDGHTQEVAIPKGAKGDTGATGPQGPQGDTGVSITGMVETGETETDTLYNITFSNGTTQAVAIPKGEKGDTGEQGPVGPQGPQGPMGDVAVITPEQQAAFTMYSTTGQNTNGPMTQKAVTDALVAGSISYNNSRSGLAATDVQGALDKIKGELTEQLYIIKDSLTRTILAGYINPQSKFTQYNGFYANRYPVSGLRQIIVEASQFTEPPVTVSYFAYVFWADSQGTSNITTRVIFHNNTKFILDVPQGANYFAITSKVTVSGIVYGNADAITVSNLDTVKETVEEMYSTMYEAQTTDFPYILQYKEIKNGYPYLNGGNFVPYSDSTIQTAFYDVSELSSIKINYTNLREDNLACAFYYADGVTSVTGTQLHFYNGAEFDVPAGAVYFGLLFRFNDNANIDVFTITANKNNGIIPNIEDLKQTQSLYNMLFDWTTYTWMLIGDSLTEANYRAETQYYEYIADKTGINWVNKARSGMGYTIDDYFYNTINGIVEEFSFATIWGSANDVRYESVSSLSNYPTWLDALGNVDDNGTSSICGYINRAIDKYYDKFPLKKIGIITPVPVKNMSANGVTLTDEETKYRVETYTEKLVTIAKNRGIPCLDMLHCSGLRPWDEAYRIEYYNENGVQDSGVHPNSKGHKLIANMVLNYVFQFMVE